MVSKLSEKTSCVMDVRMHESSLTNNNLRTREQLMARVLSFSRRNKLLKHERGCKSTLEGAPESHVMTPQQPWILTRFGIVFIAAACPSSYLAVILVVRGVSFVEKQISNDFSGAFSNVRCVELGLRDNDAKPVQNPVFCAPCFVDCGDT